MQRLYRLRESLSGKSDQDGRRQKSLYQVPERLLGMLILYQRVPVWRDRSLPGSRYWRYGKQDDCTFGRKSVILEHITKRWQQRTGYYQHFGGESWNKVLATGERKSGVDKQMDEFAGYIDFRQDINSWLSLDAGVRVDHHSHVGTEWIPQGGLAFHFPKC